MLRIVEWGEYSYETIYKLQKAQNKLTKDACVDNGTIPLFTADSKNNGIAGYVNLPPTYIVKEGEYWLIFGDHTGTFNLTNKSFCITDNVKVLKPINHFSLSILQFVNSCWKKQIKNKGYARHWSIAKNIKIQLPIRNGIIDFEFMEKFITELERSYAIKLDIYLSIAGLKDYELTLKEQQAIQDYEKVIWKEFNLEELFGKSTRGRRLKSAVRIPGELPFVTAVEAEEGVSAFIGNNVVVFDKNTTTIDMFGSAKYRNYNYGADDHVAVVHTEKLSKYSSIFITSAIHKSSYTGAFNYGRNFYPKDADKLNIILPVKNNQPDYETMETLVSAIHKLIIRDVVLYTEQKIKAIV